MMKIHKEGKSSIIIGAIILIIAGFLSIYLLKRYALFVLTPLIAIFGLILWFFRIPNRNISEHRESVVSPVDGKIVIIKEVKEEEFLKEKTLQISIFMSPLNVHICRYPVSGKIIYKKYHAGKYLVAWHEKSSTENERTTVGIETETKHRILFRQIAGYIARRIVFYCNEGDTAKAGHEYGFIKFGSRMDIFLPMDTEILCKIGDKTKGGLDIIARLKS